MATKKRPDEIMAELSTPLFTVEKIVGRTAQGELVLEPIADSPPAQPSADMAEAAEGASDLTGCKTVYDWALEKGHVPSEKPIAFRADPHRGKPHIAVVLAHTRWPINKLVSESHYDEAVTAAYNLPVGENLVAAAARKEAEQ